MSGIAILSRQFSQTNDGQELVARFKDYFNHYKYSQVELIPEKARKFSGKFDAGVPLDVKETKMQAMLASTIERLSGMKMVDSFLPKSAYANDPQYQHYTFAVIGALIDAVIPQSIIDTYGMWTDVKTGNYGDNFSFDLAPSGLFFVSKFGRAKRHAETQRDYKGQVIITPENHAISTQTSLYAVLSGKESLAEYAVKCIRSIEEQIALDCYNAFDGAFSTLPSSSTTNLLANGAFSDVVFTKLAEKVAGYNNGTAMAVGTKTALANILPTSDANYLYSLDSDYVRNGYISTYAGVPILELPQRVSWKSRYSTLLDDTRIYIISPSADKIVKLVLEGDTMEFNTDAKDRADLTNQVTFQKSWGVGVATSAIYACMDLA